MTKTLQQAFEEASKLPEQQQELIASIILGELDSERRWDELFAKSPDLLARMADEALEEDRQGKTLPLDIDRDFSEE